MNYKATPKSRSSIQETALNIRSRCNTSLDEPFQITKFIEFCLDFFDYTYDICESNEMNGTYAHIIPEKKVLKIDNDVYIAAYNNVPRHLFTLAHELGHIIFHSSIEGNLARSNGKIAVYEDPEWQANTFAAELLAPSSAVKNLTVEEISKKYHCSNAVAKIQLSKSKTATKRLKV